MSTANVNQAENHKPSGFESQGMRIKSNRDTLENDAQLTNSGNLKEFVWRRKAEKAVVLNY
jgi:hypothetical protein